MYIPVTDISTVKNTDKVSMSLRLPYDLYQKIKAFSSLSKTPINAMVEEWADKYISVQDGPVNLPTWRHNIQPREKPEPGVRMKGLTVFVSRYYHQLIKREAARKQLTIRDLVKTWIAEQFESNEHQHQVVQA